MPRPRYYRRQSELCLQLAMLQNDRKTKLLLVELAKELQAKADEPEGAVNFAVPKWLPERLRPAARDGNGAETYRITRPDLQRRRRGLESQPA
jgi:hypothetical protein